MVKTEDMTSAGKSLRKRSAAVLKARATSDVG